MCVRKFNEKKIEELINTNNLNMQEDKTRNNTTHWPREFLTHIVYWKRQ